MIKNGDLPRPDLVIFSDTGAERPETMDLIAEHIIPLCTAMDLQFDIVRSHLGRLDEYYRSRGAIPMIGARHCTAKFKIRPIRRHIREIVGNARGKLLAEAWLGITTDEAHRESVSDVRWIQNRFPLLEREISRQDCLDYLDREGYNVIKSGCFMCPYQSSQEWLEVREAYPELWKRALALEDQYFAQRPERWKGLRHDSKRLRDHLDEFEMSKCDSGGCFI